MKPLRKLLMSSVCEGEGVGWKIRVREGDCRTWLAAGVVSRGTACV